MDNAERSASHGKTRYCASIATRQIRRPVRMNAQSLEPTATSATTPCIPAGRRRACSGWCACWADECGGQQAWPDEGWWRSFCRGDLLKPMHGASRIVTGFRLRSLSTSKPCDPQIWQGAGAGDCTEDQATSLARYSVKCGSRLPLFLTVNFETDAAHPLPVAARVRWLRSGVHYSIRTHWRG